MALLKTVRIGLFLCLFPLFASNARAVLAGTADCPGGALVLAAAASFQKAAAVGTPQAFASALVRHAPVSNLALQALGPYRKNLQAKRQAEFQKNALAFMGRFVAENAAGLRGANLKVVACRGNLIESTANGRKVIWRVSGSQVLDVKVSGFSLSVQMRNKFVRVISQNNGDVGALIDFLGR